MAETDLEFPGSYQQTWVYEASPSGASNLNVVLGLRFQGPVERGALMRAVRGVVRRHEALRTVLERRGERVTQVVRESSDIAVEEIDASGLRGRERKAALRRLETALGKPFVLRAGPLVRAVIVVLGREELVLGMSVHHAVSDGWSTSVLMEDIVALYAAEVGEASGELRALDVQFGDYVVWQRETPWQGATAYWPGRLAGRQGAVHLPGVCSDVSEGTGLRTRPRRLPGVSPAAVGQLAALAKRERTTLPAVLGAGVVAALHEHIEGEVTVGLTIANRARRELRHVVGYLADDVPIRVTVASGQRFVGLVRVFAEAVAEAYDNQVPAGAIQPILGRGGTLAPMFDVKLNFLPRRQGPLRLMVGYGRRGVRVSELDLSLDRFEQVTERWWEVFGVITYHPWLTSRGGLSGFVTGNEEVIAPAVVSELGARFCATLRRASALPGRSVAELAGAAVTGDA